MAEHHSDSNPVTGYPLYTNSNPAIGFPLPFSIASDDSATRNGTSISSGMMPIHVHKKLVTAAILMTISVILIMLMLVGYFSLLVHYPFTPNIRTHSISVTSSWNETYEADMNVVFYVVNQNMFGSMAFDRMHASVLYNNACLANTSVLPFTIHDANGGATYAPAKLKFTLMSNRLDKVSLKLELAGRVTYKSWTWRRSRVARIAAHCDDIEVYFTGKLKDKVKESGSIECKVHPIVNLVKYFTFAGCMLCAVVVAAFAIFWAIYGFTGWSIIREQQRQIVGVTV